MVPSDTYIIIITSFASKILILFIPTFATDPIQPSSSSVSFFVHDVVVYDGGCSLDRTWQYEYRVDDDDDEFSGGPDQTNVPRFARRQKW